MDSADREQFVQMWDVRSGTRTGAELRHRDDIRAIAFSTQGHWIATGSEDYEAKIWDRRTGQPIGQPLRHNTWVVALAFSPDGSILATGSADGFLRLWQVPNGEAIGPAIYAGMEPKQLAFDDTGEVLIAGFGGHFLRSDLSIPGSVGTDFAERVTLASGMRLTPEGNLEHLSGSELVQLASRRLRQAETNAAGGN